MCNTLRSSGLLVGFAALVIAAGAALGGLGGALVAGGLAGLLILGAYWFSGEVATRMANAQLVGAEQAPELHRLVEELATYARLPVPRVALVDSPSPNALATGRDAQHAVVAVTTGALGLLSRAELAGVLAHELEHVRNRDILISSIAATIAGAIMSLASRNFLAILVTPIAATLIHMAISCSREYVADAAGARVHGDPETLARALEKLEVASTLQPLTVSPAAAHLFIVSPLQSVQVRSSRSDRLFSTHPPVEDRVRRLREMAGTRADPRLT